jgi:ATP-dependent RNA helicase DDX56/DBP9
LKQIFIYFAISLICFFFFFHRLKLFLEQFGIKSCVLNSELPALIRCHSISQFNHGLYDVIIASDEQALEKAIEGTNPGGGSSKWESYWSFTKLTLIVIYNILFFIFKKLLYFRGQRKKDSESGVARGIDFQFVSNVINFDFPLDVTSYIHRAGRTARGTNKVSLLTIFIFKDFGVSSRTQH